MCHKWQSYDIWFLKYQLQQADFFLSSLAISCPLTLVTAQKMKISKKWKKYLEFWSFQTSASKIIIIGYTVLEIWCGTDVIIIFHFKLFFPFYPPNSQKNKNWKKNENKHWEISSFYTSVPKIMITCYTVLEIWQVTDVIADFHFGQFFSFLHP